MPGRHPWVLAVLLLVLLPVGPTRAEGQSRQPWSVQGSAAVIWPLDEPVALESDVRIGWDGQVRYTFSRLSVGAGIQRSPILRATTGDLSVALLLGFVEPRYVVTAGSGAALYVAGRLGAGRLSCSPDRCSDDWHVTIGGGGGVLFQITPRLAADLGAQFFTVADASNSNYLTARLGLGLGL